MTADELFDDLIRSRERITYKAAYIALIGPAPDHWFMNHARAVARAVENSKPVNVDVLSIRLDALVVNDKAPNEPSEPHFKTKEYTKNQWRSVFGSWGVRRP
jgi:hypothetical protein